MTRRILYVIDSLSIGGAETLLVDLVDAARARGYAPSVAYFTPGPLIAGLEERGVQATRISTAGLRDPRALPRLIGLMRRSRPHVVHTHLTKSNLLGQLAARLAGVPLRVLSVHNMDPWRRRRALSLVHRLATAGAHRQIAVSREVAEFTAASGGTSAEGITVIDNGVDTRRFDPDAVTPLELTEFGVPAGRIAVAVIGRLVPQKDHATFLAAAATLADRVPDAHFLIVGQGELRGELERAARSRGLGPDRLTFTGIIRDMPRLLAALDVVVFSSAWEGLPVTLLEAMAMRRCVVTTAVGGIPGVATDGRDALLVPPRDPGALAEAVHAALTDPERRRRIGRAARATIEARFSAATMMERTFALYGPAPPRRPCELPNAGSPNAGSPNADPPNADPRTSP